MLRLTCLCALLIACETGVRTDGPSPAEAPPTPSAPGTDEPAPFPDVARDTQDFIVTELNFYFPDGLTPAEAQTTNPCGTDESTDNTRYAPLSIAGLMVDGFDLDGVASTDAEGLCGQADFASPDGAAGIDYAFLRVIDMVRPARPGQTVQTVLATAPAQGLIRVGLQVRGVDDWQNDDAVEVLVTHTLDTPLLGTNGKIVANSSVRADRDPAFQTVLSGQIVDGVLTTEPADLSLGHIDLLVIEDRVITLKDAVVRGRMHRRPDGSMEVDAVLSGWWLHDNLRQAMGYALLTIGANPGELDCVLERWSDYSSDGEHCDGISMIFKVKAISGFLTGLEAE